jgi:sugar transferase (PEP-CTERM/EpsH1 system associated)
LNSSQKNKQLVFVTSRFPYPLEKGDKLRAFYQLKELSKHFDVHLVALHESIITIDQLKAVESYCASVQTYFLPKWLKWLFAGLQLFGSKPIQVGYFYNPFVQRKIRQKLQWIQPDHIYCQLVRASEYVKDYHDCHKTLDYMDALSKGMERRMEKASYFKRMLFKMEFKRLLKYENTIFEYFEHHTIISEEDKKQLFHKDFSKIMVIKNGVDERFFEPMEQAQEYDLVFTGNMSYAPNVKAALFLVNEVLPLCQSTVKLAISGANPVQEVRALASGNVTITGWVDDIREAYANSKVFIAPMTIGTGLQNKLLEAMAMSLPCITTNLANRALGASPNEHILVGNTPRELAQHIDQLVGDEQLRNSLSTKGREFVAAHFKWENVTYPLIQLLKQ